MVVVHYVRANRQVVDHVRVPATLVAGDYVVQYRWGASPSASLLRRSRRMPSGFLRSLRVHVLLLLLASDYDHWQTAKNRAKYG